MIDAAEEHLAVIRDILREHAQDCTALVFGSRVNGKSQKFSDIDIALRSSKKIDPATLSKLREAFAVSDLPIRVDVVDYHAVSPEFREIIEREYETLHP